MYIDGRLVYQGHNIEPQAVLSYAGFTSETHYVENKDSVEAMHWEMPERLETFISYAEKEDQ